ncbi:NUDIX hydrolase domain-like protein [Zopfochytrium polystomum]|nr:NUDIX hydrolase domain-like protein [Zopfochytrium polystomum]
MLILTPAPLCIVVLGVCRADNTEGGHRCATKRVQTILVVQFRPPVGGYVVEFPAGLVDENESAESAAERELREETGYSGKSVRTSNKMASNPGISNSTMAMVVVEVDLDSPENATVTPQLDEGEHIERHVIYLDDLIPTLDEFRSKGLLVDSRVDHLAFGLSMGKYNKST